MRSFGVGGRIPRLGGQRRDGWTFQPLPKTIARYILRVSGAHQPALLLLSITVFALSAVPLEIQRRVVNDAFRGGAAGPIVWLAISYLCVALLEGGVKLVLNIYRGWVSETAVLDLRRAVSVLAARAGHEAGGREGDGTRMSMVLSEAAPIGGFVGISISEPLLQAGIVASVFGYLVYLHPAMAVICAVAMSLQMVFVPVMQSAINRRVAGSVETLRRVGDDIVGAPAGEARKVALHESHTFVTEQQQL